MKAGSHLCSLDDIPDGEAKGFGGDGAADFFVVRRGERIYAWRNCCPHTGVSMEWMPDKFLELGGGLIICGTHGARFRIADGYCISGPCQGDALTPVSVEVVDGQLFLKQALE